MYFKTFRFVEMETKRKTEQAVEKNRKANV